MKPDKVKSFKRVRTEIGKQNYRTFPELFKDFLLFFLDSFFIDSNSLNTANMQDFFPIRDCKDVSPSSSLFLPDFSSAYCLHALLSFLPFRISALQDFIFYFTILLIFVAHCIQKTVSIIFKDFL